MGFLTILCWLIMMPVRIVYMVCLVGVTRENFKWVGHHEVVLNDYALVLPFVGVLWLWSNMIVGLVCLLICSIVHSIDDNEEDNCKIFHNILFILQSIVGILWLWSHMKLLFNLALLGFVIYVIVTLLPTAEIWRNITDANKENAWWIIVGSILAEILEIFQEIVEIAGDNYYGISKTFWRNMYCSMQSSGFASEIYIRSSTISAQNDTSVASRASSCSSTLSEVHTTRSKWQAMFGQNINQGGTQTIGSIRIGEYVIQIRAIGGRDINFYTYIVGDIDRNL